MVVVEAGVETVTTDVVTDDTETVTETAGAGRGGCGGGGVDWLDRPPLFEPTLAVTLPPPLFLFLPDLSAFSVDWELWSFKFEFNISGKIFNK